MIKDLPEQEVMKSEIRELIKGFYVYKEVDDNPFYAKYAGAWERLYCDLEKTNNIRMSYYMVLSGASNTAREILMNCNNMVIALRKNIQVYAENLENYSQNVDIERQQIVNELALVWKSASKNNKLWSAVQYNLTIYNTYDFRNVKIKSRFGNLDTYIINSAKEIEDRIMKIAKTFVTHLGLHYATIYAQNNGKMKRHQDITDNELYTDQATIGWLPPIYRSIQDLLVYGHLVGEAVKIRFYGLNKAERYTHQQCYDIIETELKELGFKPDDILPDEAKALSDRARRYGNDRSNNLQIISRNQTR
jgi:hypothetical protein